MKQLSLELFKKENIKFDKYYWAVTDKSTICKKENIDFMIEDNLKYVKDLIDNKIKTLYYRDVNMLKIEENEFVKEVNNWGDIYRYLRELK